MRSLLVLACFAAATLCAAQSAAPNSDPPSPSEITVNANKSWIDTGIDVHAGDRCTAVADGLVMFDRQLASPDGLSRGWRDVVSSLPLNSIGRGALIGRIGDTGAPFALGRRSEFVAVSAGRLFLGVNQSSTAQGNGNYGVKLSVAHPANESAGTAAGAVLSAAKFEIADSAGILGKVPRRIGDKDGNAGDAINFFVVGSGDRLLEAFRAAGWVVVDRNAKAAVLHGLLSTLSKQAYVELPMSELYLFGRAQDYGLAHAEPLQVVSSRHHLRLWKAPLEVQGEELWVGAATHDIGFDRDQRNGGVTHKIDPNVDDEREYVRTSLLSTGMFAGESALTPDDAVREARTATGGSFHTDGRIFVFRLAPAAKDSKVAAQ